MICREPGVLKGSEYFIFQGREMDRSLHPYMALCGHYRCTFGYGIKREYYDYLLISYIVEGTFHLKYRGREYQAGPGQIVMIDCQHPHHFWAGKSMEFVWIHFSGGNTHQICRDLNDHYGPVLDHRHSAYIRDRLTSLVSRFRTNQKITAPAIAGLILDLMYRIYPGENDFSLTEKTDHPAVRASIEYMKYHLGSSMNIDELANAAGLSRYHFSRIFKEHTGVSPYDYLLGLRMDMARHLLNTTNQSVNEIAYNLGYQSQMGFTMAFTKREGISPGEYRKQSGYPSH